MVVFLVFCFSAAFGKCADPFNFTGISVGLTHETKSTCITNSPRYSSGMSFDKISDGVDSIRRARSKKYKKGDTLFYCEVLKLSNQDYREHWFAVFGYAYISDRKGRSKLRIKYILKRERNYLSKVFYTKAMLIERRRVDISLRDYMKKLEKKFPNIRMWGVLDANAMLN